MSERRKSVEVEQLEREVASLRRQLEERRRDPGDMPVTGCGDDSCIVERTRGMATNGGCRCSEHTLRIAMRWWRRTAGFREETIREMKGEREQVKAFALALSDVWAEHMDSGDATPGDKIGIALHNLLAAIGMDR